MRLLIIFFIIVGTRICHSWNYYTDVFYPDVLLNLLPSIRISESNNFTITQDFASFSETFTKKADHFGKYFRTALSGNMGKLEREILSNLTRGITDEFKATSSRYDTLYGAANNMIYHEYNTEVVTKLKSRLADIEWISRDYVWSEEAEAEFKSQCQIGDNTPNAIALYLASIVEKCGQPHLSQTADAYLFKLINTVIYKEYTMTPSDERLFHKRFAAVHHWLSSHEDNLSAFEGVATRDVIFRNKATMLGVIMNDFGITEEYTFCPVKNNFVANFYRRDSVIDFAGLLMNHVTVLNYYTALCARASQLLDNRVKEYGTNVQKALRPMYRFIDTWLGDFLNSTWPNTESLLIRNIIQDVSRSRTISHQNGTYKQILDKVKEKMELVGHPDYRRQYVITGQRRLDDKSENFGFGCAPNACTLSSTKNVQVVSIRTPAKKEERSTKQQKLGEFKNTSEPVFSSAMDKHYYNFFFPSMVLHQLKHEHDLDLNNFVNHSSYVLLRKSRYFSGCSNAFATGADDNSNYLQTLHYHWDGSFPFKDCEDWLIIIG